MAIARAVVARNLAEDAEEDLKFLALAARDGLALGEEVVVESVAVCEGPPALLAQTSRGMAVFVIGDIKGRDGLPGIVNVQAVGWSTEVAPRLKIRRG